MTDYYFVQTTNIDFTVYNILSFIIYLGSTSAAGNYVKAGSPASPHGTRHQPHRTRSPQGSCRIEFVQASAHKLKAKA